MNNGAILVATNRMISTTAMQAFGRTSSSRGPSSAKRDFSVLIKELEESVCKLSSERIKSGVVRSLRNNIVIRQQQQQQLQQQWNQQVRHLRNSSRQSQQQKKPNQPHNKQLVTTGNREMSHYTAVSPKTLGAPSRRACRGRRRLKATLSATSSSSSSGGGGGGFSSSGGSFGSSGSGSSSSNFGSGSGGFEGGSSRFTTAFREFINKVNAFLLKPRTIPIPRWVSPNHHSITITECLGHSSFILVATSYAVDDFLMLRCIAVAGSTAMLFFTYFHPHGRVLWLPFKWNLLFIAINSSRIFKALSDKYNAKQLSPEIESLRDAHFYLMDQVDFAKLMSIATIETYRKGDIVVDEDEPNRYVRFIIDGKLNCLYGGDLNYVLEEGNFCSEVGLHAGLLLSGGVESCCTIEAATKNVRVLKWDRTKLIDLLLMESGVQRSLKAVLSWDIMRKLKAQRKLLESGIIDDPKDWTVRRHEQGQKRYVGMLRNMLSSPYTLAAVRKEHLTKYRMIHHIDDETHNEALKQCGWTPEEFERGYQFEDNENNSKGFKSSQSSGLLNRHLTTIRRDVLLRMQK